MILYTRLHIKHCVSLLTQIINGFSVEPHPLSFCQLLLLPSYPATSSLCMPVVSLYLLSRLVTEARQLSYRFLRVLNFDPSSCAPAQALVVDLGTSNRRSSLFDNHWVQSSCVHSSRLTSVISRHTLYKYQFSV